MDSQRLLAVLLLATAGVVFVLVLMVRFLSGLE